MRGKIVAAIVLLMLVMVVLNVQPVRAQKTKIVVGFSMPLLASMPTPLLARMHHLYYFMLFDDYNRMGGLNVPGYGKLEIEYLMLTDDYSSSQNIANYLTLLGMLQNGEIDLIFAPWSTARNVEVIPYFEEARVPLVGLTVGSDEIHEKLKDNVWNWFFVTLGQPCEDVEEIIELFTYMNSKLKPADRINKIGIGYRDDEHGIEHAKALRTGLIASGMTVPVYLEYDADAPPEDWSDYITAFSTAGVDVVIMCGYAEIAGFVAQCISKGYNPKGLIVGPGLETPFFVYDVFGFTYGQFAGIMYYNGFPANSYDKEPYYSWARVRHPEASVKHVGIPFYPFPASANFYMGVEAIFQAVEKVGLNMTRIRDALEFWTFNLTLGGWTARVGRPPISFKFRQSEGKSPIIGEHGTITQWQGEVMMDVIWPSDKASTEWIIYPKFPWTWATVPDHYRDGFVDMMDVRRAAKAFGAEPGDIRWDPVVDWVKDDFIDMMDIRAVAKAFGQSAPFGGVIYY